MACIRRSRSRKGSKVTADKENLARLSFQRFFRSYPIMAGMTGTAWESRGEMWQIYQRPIVRIPTNKPVHPQASAGACSTRWTRNTTPWSERVCELNDRGVPVLVGTRSVLSSEEVSRRLTALGKAASGAERDADGAGSQHRRRGRGAGADHRGHQHGRPRHGHQTCPRRRRKLGGLHVLSTEPATSGRVDRQLFGRAARQGDPGCAQLFASVPMTICLSATRRMLRKILADDRRAAADLFLPMARRAPGAVQSQAGASQ
jgi:preprotein translocase subunit SecA